MRLLIGILFAIGVGFLFLGNIDRIIWSMTRDGAQVGHDLIEVRCVPREVLDALALEGGDDGRGGLLDELCSPLP